MQNSRKQLFEPLAAAMDNKLMIALHVHQGKPQLLIHVNLMSLVKINIANMD
jgi:hypothetical protein